MKNIILNYSNYNVFILDWSTYADIILYPIPAADAIQVGDTLANFINLLITCKNVTADSFQCIGHSLGAHLCGAAGSYFNNPQIGRITGLDPAGPEFTFPAVYTSLNRTNAKLVTLMHTNMGGMGFVK